MFARVVTWEGGDADAIRQTADRINEQAESGPPEGVPAKSFLLLTDADNGRALAVTLFETEEDYAQGDETLNSMNPPDDGLGRRTGVEKYEVGVNVST